MKHDSYMVRCWMPETALKHFFVVSAVSEEHADAQARDAYFGLLNPPSIDVRQKLIVEVEKV